MKQIYILGLVAATGGIAGENYGMIKRSSNKGKIKGEESDNYNSVGLGGIAGSNHATVYLCYNLGAVEGKNYVGGIVGTSFDRDELIACYNLGDITGTTYVGGIVGRNGSTSNLSCYGGVVKSSYNAGKIIGTSSVGTICGVNKEQGQISNCYCLKNEINGVGSEYAKNTEIIQKTTEEMQTTKFVELLNKDGKIYFINSGYPQIDLEGSKIIVEYGNKTNNTIQVILKADEPIRPKNGWQMLPDSKTLIRTFHINTEKEITIEDYNYNQSTVTIKIDTLADSIIKSDNYYIETFDHLQALAEEVNNGNNCEGKEIYLMNDINIPKNYCWDVIGNSNTNPFKGNFYGNSNKIYGINFCDYSNYKGLFGYIEKAKIENIELEGIIEGESHYTGAVAGYAKNCDIKNCHNYINIKEKYNKYDNNLEDTWGSKVGGIIGYASNTLIYNCSNNSKIDYQSHGSSGTCGGIIGDATTCKLTYCNNRSNIESTGAYYIGGIAGYAYFYGTIEKCYNTGEISSNSIPQGMGGITGEVNAGTLKNNYNFGEIKYNGTGTTNGTASIYKLGGIVGETYNDVTIQNCYNIGNLNTGGAIVGSILSSKGTITNNYYLSTSSELGYYSSKIGDVEILNKTQEEMQTGEFISLLNNNTNVWHYDKDNKNKGYPFLGQLKDIRITTEPAKINYICNENFDKTGMVVKAVYDNDTEEEKTNYVIEDETNLKYGKTGVKITYTEEGMTKEIICEITVNHDYKETITAPTCTNQGYTEHTCKVCRNTYKDTYINAKGHTEVIDKAVEATCTSKGKTEGSHCSVCNATILAQKEIPALGHSFTRYVINNATCTKDGTKTAKCDRCNETDTITDIGSALGHNYENGVCTRCGEEEPKITITSNEYTIDTLNAYITNIQPKTTLSKFKEEIKTNATKIEVYNSQTVLSDSKYVATGMKVGFTLNSEKIELTLVVRGDVNGDGEADFKDMSAMNSHRLGKKEIQGANYLAGNVEINGDSKDKIDFKDMSKINSFRLRKINEL